MWYGCYSQDFFQNFPPSESKCDVTGYWETKWCDPPGSKVYGTLGNLATQLSEQRCRSLLMCTRMVRTSELIRELEHIAIGYSVKRNQHAGIPIIGDLGHAPLKIHM